MTLCLRSSSYQRFPPANDPKIPLIAVDVKGDMINFVGHITILQTFINHYPTAIEVKYLFHLDNSNATVIGMKMKIGEERILVSHITEKTQARQTYEKAIYEKKMTCLLEKASNGIYTVNVGNILPDQKVQIEIEYISQLDCTDDGEMKFILPTNISPKYDDPQKTITDILDNKKTLATMTFTPAAPFSFHVDLIWKSKNSIQEVKSLTNEITVSPEDKYGKVVRIKSVTAPRNGDFNVLVKTDVTPTVYVSHDGEDSYLMINHRVRDELVDIEGGEFTILIDRSGSMEDSFTGWSGSGAGINGGRKIDFAREAAKLFVQSLPLGSKFNVVSFGSDFRSIFPIPVEYTDVTKRQALDEIARFEADMGGTELFNCLSTILSGERKHKAPNPDATSSVESNTASSERIIILMTDGDVGNLNCIVKLIQRYSYNSRVFTIGIGQDVNRFLCEQVAAASNACTEIMVDNPNISTTVAKMLDAAIKSYYQHSTVIIGHRQTQIHKAIYSNNFLSIYQKVPRSELQLSPVIRLQSLDAITKKTSEWKLEVNLEEGNESEGKFIQQLYAADKIKELEQNNEQHQNTHEIINLSCRYGIMNDRTSFVVVDVIANSSIENAPKEITIPQFQDYHSNVFCEEIDVLNKGYVVFGHCDEEYEEEEDFAEDFADNASGDEDFLCTKETMCLDSFIEAERETEKVYPTTARRSLHDFLPGASSIAVPSSEPPSPAVKLLNSLLNYQSADGSFQFYTDSLSASTLNIAAIEAFAGKESLSNILAFNLMILKMFRSDGSKKYVMIIRNLEKWIDKQLLTASHTKSRVDLLQEANI